MIPHLFRAAMLTVTVTGVTLAATVYSDASWLKRDADGASFISQTDSGGVPLNSPGIVERSLCLTASLVRNAAYQCGDLVMSYALPYVRVLGKAQAPVLLYNSQHAHPHPLITLDVAIPTGVTVPDKIEYLVRVGSETGARSIETITRTMLETNLNNRKRIQVGWDAALDQTGVYPVHIEAKSYYGGTTYSASILHTEIIVVNRKDSPFGSGWWVAGVDQLFFPTDTTRLLVSGDGSARLFRQPVPNVPNVWIADMLDRPDTLTYSSSTYKHRLSGGATVEFDAQGRHRSTIDARSFSTKFWYRSSSTVAMLDSIQLPRLTTSYRFQYKMSGADTTVETIRAPGVTGDRITSVLATGPSLHQIYDPIGADLYFLSVYAGVNAGRVYYLRSSRGLDSYFGYDNHGHMSRLKVNMPSRTDVTQICPVFTVADTVGCGTRFKVVSNAVVELNGPSTNATYPDVWQYRLARFGAPSWVRNPKGDSSVIQRDSARLPAFVTRVRAANGLVTHAKPDSMGNVAEVTVDNALGDTFSQTTKYQWDLRWDKVKRVINNLNETTFLATYDAVGNVDSIGDSRVGSATRFYYGDGADLHLLQVSKPPARATADDYQYLTYDALGNPTGAYQYTASGTTTTLIRGTHFTQDAIGRNTVRCVDIDSLTEKFPPQHCHFTTYDIFGRDSVIYEHAPAFNSVPEQVTYVRNYYGNEGELVASAREKGGAAWMLYTRYAHDKLGRVTKQWHLYNDATMNDTTYTTYNDAGDAVSTTNRRGNTITMTYDGMHQLLQRNVPVRSEAAASPDSSFALERGPYPLNMGGFTMAADSYNFQYDEVGNVVRATNNNSHIYRGYTPNGLLKGDTSEIAKAGGGFAQYILLSDYDALNRRTALHMPSALVGGDGALHFAYAAVTSELSSVTDPLNNSYSFAFNKRGEQTFALLAGGISQSFQYDAVGSLARDSAFKTVPGVLRHSTFTYDNRGKRLSAIGVTTFGDTASFLYSGIGHLVSSRLVQHTTNFGGGVNRGVTMEKLTTDPLGNALARTSRDSVQFNTSTGSDATTSVNTESPITLDSLWRVRHAVGTMDGALLLRSYHYDEDGNVFFYFKKPTSSTSSAFREDRYSWYDAEGRLRAADYRLRKSGSDGTTPDVTVEQYQYDALGRRYAVRTERYCGDGAPQFLCNVSSLRRTLWDGERELMEIQVPTRIPTLAPIGDTLLNNDNYQPRLARALGGVDYNPYWGRVLYVPGLSLDQPVGFIRYNYADRTTTTASTDSLLVMPATAMSIIWDQDGLPRVWCVDGSQRCSATRENSTHVGSQIVTLAAETFMLDRPRLDKRSWQGTLLHDKEDGTRTNFRRNRYYDPTSGVFTQEDPIGLAGGLNLYGFAGGDPVNFGDPFGLLPCWLVSSASCRDNVVTTTLKRGFSAELAGFSSAFDPSAGGPPPGGGAGWLLGMAAYRVGLVGAAEGTGAAVARGAPTNSQIINSVIDLGADVRIGRTAKNAGEFVNIKFRDGTVINFRVETHDPFGYHGNVDIWRPGQNPLKKHIFPGDN